METDYYLVGDQPTTCPKCGARSEIMSENDVKSEIIQEHACLNEGCHCQFIVFSE